MYFKIVFSINVSFPDIFRRFQDHKMFFSILNNILHIIFSLLVIFLYRIWPFFNRSIMSVIKIKISKCYLKSIQVLSPKSVSALSISIRSSLAYPSLEKLKTSSFNDLVITIIKTIIINCCFIKTPLTMSTVTYKK